MKWILKAVVQKIISFLPGTYRVNLLFQRHITVGRELPEAFVKDKVRHAQWHIGNQITYGTVLFETAGILEIGTGWYPVVPVVFFLAGATDIVTTDIRKLYTRSSVNSTLRAVIRLCEHKALPEGLPPFPASRINVLKEALKLKSVPAKFKMLHITSTICKSTKYTIASQSRDLIVSNNTLQFIRKEELSDFFVELGRIARAGSILSMAVDLTDEFSHSDTSIGPYHFLKFSDFEWRLITSRLNSPNRLRWSDYRNLVPGNFKIIREELDEDQQHEADKIPIHPQFKRYSKSDLLIRHARFVYVKVK